MCLRSVHLFQPITFQELRSYLTSHPYISFRFHFMHTPQHRTASVVSFLSIPQAPFIQSLPKLFSHAFPVVCFSFLRRVSPINRLKAERKVITPYRWVVVRSASSIHSVTTQAFSPRISSGMFYFLRRVSPNKTKPLRESGKREECFNLDYHWRLSRE